MMISNTTTTTTNPAEKAAQRALETVYECISECRSFRLEAGAGAGKTYSLTTFVECGIETFVLITDPNGEESLIDAMEKKGLPMDLLHWHYVAQASPSWATLREAAKIVNTLSYSAVTQIKSGIKKENYQQWIALINCCFNFKCDRTGEEFGPVDFFGPDRAFAIDSLSGMNTMAMDLTIGAEPVAHEGEWGVAMAMEEKLIKKFLCDLKCFFVLVGHVQRTVDPLVGGTQIMVDSLGKKLAPKIPKDFSDVVYAVREGKNFHWSTIAPNVDLKARTLPLADKLQPDFGQIVDAWKRRTKVAQVTETKKR